MSGKQTEAGMFESRMQIGGTPSSRGKKGPGRARSAHTTGQKSIGKKMDAVNVKVQKKIQIYLKDKLHIVE